jgi:exosortase/archaeosortase family protein
VAEECSGIHSAIALLLSSVVAGKLFLAAGWRRAALILVVFPIAVMKNGLRIVTLTLLGNYVDQSILSGPLHKQGGVPFFLLALSVLGLVIWLLRKTEKSGDTRKEFAVATRVL